MSVELSRTIAPPFAALLHEAEDGTFEADPGIDLTSFLTLALHRDYFPLGDEERLISTHPEVFRKVSLLFRAIFAGNPPTCPPLSADLAHTHLRGLSPEQKAHLERVLLYGTDEISPPLLKDLGGVSPYSPEANRRPIWQRSATADIAPEAEGAAVDLDAELHELWATLRTPSDPLERQAYVMGWYERCFVEVIDEGIKYVLPLAPSPISKGGDPLRIFLGVLVVDGPTEAEYQELEEELFRRKALERKGDDIVAALFFNVLVPAVVASGVSLNPPPP